MPQYEFRNVHTGDIVEVRREISARDIPPTAQELMEHGIKDSDQRAGPWHRIISGGINKRVVGETKGYYNNQHPTSRVYDTQKS